MAKFCRFCGNPVPQGANFCRTCGKSLAESPAEKAEPARSVRNASPRGQDAAFRPQQAQPTRTAPSPASFAQEPALSPLTPQVQTLTASAAAGEFDFGGPMQSGFSGNAKPLSGVLPPVSGLFHGIGSFLGGALKIFVKPGALIGTLLLAGLWFALAQFGDPDSEVVKALSWLTFAQGGAGRSIPGAVCGVLGKGTAAAALISLFSGGLGRFFKGIGAFFAGHGERRSFLSFLFGLVLGAGAYFAFAGPELASADTAMAGIAGAVLSLEALGGGTGKLYELAQSLTSRAENGVRSAVRGRCDGLLTGMTLGFALGTAVPLFL